MANPAGESNAEVLRLDFDRRLMLQFRGSVVTKYAIRLPVNRILQERIGHLLTRPVGRPSNEVRRSYANFGNYIVDKYGPGLSYRFAFVPRT